MAEKELSKEMPINSIKLYKSRKSSKERNDVYNVYNRRALSTNVQHAVSVIKHESTNDVFAAGPHCV